jgi:hypothetical protein
VTQRDAVADALALAARGTDLLARLGGPWGEAARAAARELERVDKVERARRLAEVRLPVPPGVRGVHRSWLEHGLAGLPLRARRAVAEGPSDPIDTWLARWACRELPPLLVSAARDVRVPADLAALGGEALHAWLAAVGRAHLAAAAAIARREQRRDALGPARALIVRCEGGDVLAIAARALAPHLAHDPLAGRRLAVRLPRDLGRAIERELAAHAADPLADAPAWAALVASTRGT